MMMTTTCSNNDVQSFLSFLELKNETIEIELEKSLGFINNNHLGTAISYSLLSKAKRIRPLLCIASNNYCKANYYIQHAIGQIDRNRPSSEVLVGLAKYIIQRLD